ncbi:alanine/glycine:cation symporter family protein [Thalassotalea sp. LPB0316]|uniref:alanine/glycine:cation symporter family protein n=1 Tax=Thalassotalea sp. LPB0316 TaxID=2769490 RepID=UPI001D03DC22|nr:alanine/glycine:cation symporter family protein [Thalassotalea sp. LPB0316]
MSLDNQINQLLEPIAELSIAIIFYSITIFDVDIPLIVIWLICASLFFTFYFNWLNIRGFKHALKVIKGDYSSSADPGEVSHFQALTTALSGTVGLGNIAGVAIAVSIGGPGATFWMIVAGILGMATKFLECSLGVKYRIIDKDGQVHGGPMYYLRDGLKEIGYAKTGKLLAVIFAICCVVASLCGSNMLQSNQAYQQFMVAFGSDDSFWSGKGWLFGSILALLVGIVIIGGIKSIAQVTSKIVPFMAFVYLCSCTFILFYHLPEIPTAFGLIIHGAFDPNGVAGGIIGVMIQGFKRATFSSEAGVGAASIAHAAATTKEPIREGYVALIEPFIDTVVICTLTALVIVITGSYQTTQADGVALTSQAFASVIWWFPYLLSVAVLLFALSTMISWAYYGSIAWQYLVGENKAMSLLYKLIFCLFTIIGASISLQSVIDISDSMFFSMAIANIIGLYLLAPMIKKDLKVYQQKYTKKK